jgi:peroxiredoxin
LTALHESFRDQGLVVMAVNAWDEPADTVRKFVEEKKLTHTIVMDGRAVAGDSFGVKGIPVTYLIDRDGKVRWMHVGFAPGDEKKMEAKIRELL